jgi:p21-activated kinase 1
MEPDLPPEKRRQKLVKRHLTSTSSTTALDNHSKTRDSKLSSHSSYRSNINEAGADAHFSLTHKTSAQLIGPAFDAEDLINQLSSTAHAAATPYNSNPQPSLIAHSSTLPTTPHLQHANTLDERLLSPKLRTSQSHVALGHKMDRITPPRSETSSTGTKSPRQRYSDEAKPEFGKKKGMFASFLNGVKGSPRRPTISSPVNPTHVTHVSFDQDTGTLTVCDDLLRALNY